MITLPTRKFSRPVSLFIFILLGSSFLPAQAYLDPGSGSLIIQSIIGGVAAVGITLKLYWHKIRVKLGGHKASETEVHPQESCSSKD